MRSRRIVLFGAGASYGSDHVIPYRPPLMDKLYSMLYGEYHSWRNLPPDAHRLFSSNFESGMEFIWNNYSTLIPRLMLDLAKYFASFAQDATDNNLFIQYVKALSKHLDKYNIVFSTLNYDMLLEMACSSIGFQCIYFGEETNSKTASIWKLHGSCNLLPKNLRIDAGVHYVQGVSFNPEVQPVSRRETIEYCNSNTALYPSMSIPIPSKQTQIASEMLRRFQRSWADMVKDSERILVIGVRPNPNDKHIWDPLLEATGKVGYVASKEEFDSWLLPKRNSVKTEFFGSRWEDCFQSTIDFVVG